MSGPVQIRGERRLSHPRPKGTGLDKPARGGGGWADAAAARRRGRAPRRSARARRCRRARPRRSAATQASKRALDDLHDACELYPDLEKNLADAGATFIAREPLIAGPSIVETVFEGPRVALDHGVRTELTLTWWEFRPPRPVARVAELSYKVKTNDDLSRDAARRASRLYRAPGQSATRLPGPRASEQDRPCLAGAGGGARLAHSRWLWPLVLRSRAVSANN